MDAQYRHDLVTMGLTFLLLACVLIRKKRRAARRLRRYKTRPINRNRKQNNFYRTYFLPMKRSDEEQFFKYTRMTVLVFEELLELIKGRITKRRIADGIGAEERLAITLHFLSQGGSMQSIAWTYHMEASPVRQIIYETCSALWDTLSPTYLCAPQTEADWKEIAAGFWTKCNFPNCIGALDGKHINIQAPTHSGSLFFNYKKFHSIVLLATCDARYCFTLVDIGAYGSHSDGGIFRNSVFGQRLDENSLHVPPVACLPHTVIEMPYVLVADEAFPLKDYIMRPFSGRHLTFAQKNFNYRLSRARRLIENTFGVMVAWWRLLKQSITADGTNVDLIVQAVVVLHNFCRIRTTGRTPTTTYCSPGYTDTGDEDNGQWRHDVQSPLQSVGRLASNNSQRWVYALRDRLTHYFTMVGSVPWQDAYVRCGREPE